MEFSGFFATFFSFSGGGGVPRNRKTFERYQACGLSTLGMTDCLCGYGRAMLLTQTMHENARFFELKVSSREHSFHPKTDFFGRCQSWT